MEIRAYGKINPALNVGHVRADGYHEVCLMMQQVDLYDLLILEKLPDPREGEMVRFSSSRDLGIPDEKNLVVKAARLMQERCGAGPVSVYLQKDLPAAAGMAGGSTDAAAVIRGMNEVFGLHLSLEQMMETAAILGSDVPYCLVGGTALCTGRGEKVRPLPDMPACSIMVFKPEFGVSTPWAYSRFRENMPDNPPADIQVMEQTLEQQNLEGLCSLMRNQLYPPVAEEYPVLEQIIRIMEAAGAIKAMMTGSGPAVFGIFRHKEEMDEALDPVEKALEEADIRGTLYLTGSRSREQA
ncbi:MAG: 4-(cytidine 5'-diphospho)-2-C-methyl-D-erythritol kinase [Lachnospiraceae bacterium]|nr:4-(cytidine 5'-diphospho)-2-C-methyl-D-erythritol kinase [Lachnospiraceae bacterium]